MRYFYIFIVMLCFLSCKKNKVHVQSQQHYETIDYFHYEDCDKGFTMIFNNITGFEIIYQRDSIGNYETCFSTLTEQDSINYKNTTLYMEVDSTLSNINAISFRDLYLLITNINNDNFSLNFNDSHRAKHNIDKVYVYDEPKVYSGQAYEKDVKIINAWLKAQQIITAVSTENSVFGETWSYPTEIMSCVSNILNQNIVAVNTMSPKTERVFKILVKQEAGMSKYINLKKQSNQTGKR